MNKLLRLEPGYLILISATAALASLLTFFSGFGLGTLLLPLFAVFLPLDAAIAATGMVHFFNSLFKLLLTGKGIHYRTLLLFGLPAMAGALLGSWLLVHATGWQQVYPYRIGNALLNFSPLKLGIALLMIAFSLAEIIPAIRRLHASPRWLVPGGVLSGFMGGLSGHQGALRNIFLIRMLPSKEAFIATGVAIACLVDITRLPIYFSQGNSRLIYERPLIFILPVLAAFLGAVTGNRLLKKVTFPLLQRFVAVAIIVFACCMGIGLI